MKVEKLTQAQEKKLATHRDKWLKIGLSTKSGNHTTARKLVRQAYKNAGLKEPTVFIWLKSPLQGAIAAAQLVKAGKAGAQVWAQVWAQVRAQVGAQVGDQVWDQVRDQVGDQVGDQVWAQVWAQVGAQVGAQVWDQVGAQVGAQVRDQVGDQVGAQVWDQVGDQVGDQVWAQVWDQVWAQVGAQVGAQVRDQVGDQVGDQVWAQVWAQVGAQVGAQVWAQVGAQVGDQVWDQVGDQEVRDQLYKAGYGAFDANWLGFYAYFREVCGLKKETERLVPLMKLAEHCGFWWPFNGLVIFTEKPVEIHMRDLRLHKEEGVSVRFSDDFAVHALNGVRVPAWIAETPVKKFTKEMIIGEKNADYRREIIRRIGVVKAKELLGAQVIDEENGYTLLSIEMGDGRKRPMLEMKNPSLKGVVHIEGVQPGTSTVRNAIMYRNGLTSFGWPKSLDGRKVSETDVADYHQQGDFLAFPLSEMPEGAKRTRSKIAADGLVRHICEGGTIYEMDQRRFISVSKQAKITHPEHKTTTLEAGVWEVKRVMEYDHLPEESRQVID